MQSVFKYEIAGNIRSFYVEDGQSLRVGRGRYCEILIDAEGVKEIEAEIKFVLSQQKIVVSFPKTGTQIDRSLPFEFVISGFPFSLSQVKCPNDIKPIRGFEITVDGLSKGPLNLNLKGDRMPLILGSDANCDVVVDGADNVQLAAYAVSSKSIWLQILDTNTSVDWLGRGGKLEGLVTLPASLTVAGKLLTLIKREDPAALAGVLASKVWSNAIDADEFDEFGYDSGLARMNRLFDRAVNNFFLNIKLLNYDSIHHFRKLLINFNENAAISIIIFGVLISFSFVMDAVSSNTVSPLGPAILTLITTFVIQYTAVLFSAANLRLTFGEPITLLSRMLPRSLMLFGTITSIVCLLIGVAGAVAAFRVSIELGLFLLFACLLLSSAIGYIPWLVVRAEVLLNVRYSEENSQNAADYANNVTRFLGRILLAYAPVLSTIGAISANMVIACLLYFTLIRKTQSTIDIESILIGSTSFIYLIASLLTILFLPLLVHLVYIASVSIAEVSSAFFRMVAAIEDAPLSENTKPNQRAKNQK